MPAPLNSVRAAYQRLGCTPAEAWALAILAVAAAACVGLLWVQARPAPDHVEGAVGGGIPTAVASTPPGGVVVSQGEVIVHVAGAVARPGVYTLPGGSRVGDALDAAEGPLRRAVLDGLNLARPLTDGEQVLVPDRKAAQPAPTGGAPTGSVTGSAAAGAVGSGSPTAAPVNLNQATVADLETLPGIGPVLAGRIIQHRDSVGGFTEVGQLRDVPGIGEKTFQALADLVSL